MQPLLAALLCVYALDAPRVYEQQVPYQHIFAVDFDGDRHTDVGIANGTTFTIRYGSGDGRLSAPQTVNLGVVGVADLTGSRLPDLIAPGTRVAENRGNRLFAPPIRMAEFGPFVTADFTSDGREDLLILNASSTQVTLYVHGDGILARQFPHSLPQPTGVLAAGDVNGDGRADLIALHKDGGSVHVLYGDGGGSFGQPVQLIASWPAVSVTAADLDRDGRDDVILGEEFQRRARVEVFYGGTTPSMTIRLPDYAFGATPSVQTHDFTGDGAPDVLVSLGSPAAHHILANDGSGQLAVTQPVLFTESSPATAGDFDEDGAADLVLSSRAGFKIVPWNGGAPNAFARKLGAQFSGNLYASGDVNQDGLDDFAFFDDTGALRVAVNDGTGAFTLETIPGRHATLQFQVTISSGEVLVTNHGSTLRVFRRTAAGVWQERLTYTGNAILQAYTGDLGVDGFKELVVLENAADDPAKKALRIFSGSTGNLIQEVVLGTHLFAAFTVDDMNGDGRTDLVVTTSGASDGAPFSPSPLPNGAVQVLHGRGDATFRAPVTIASALSPLHPQAGDFNGDGRRDVVYTELRQGLVAQYGIASGFTAPAIVLNREPSMWSATARDLDEDGLTDIVTGFGTDLVTLFGTPEGLVRGGTYWSPSGFGAVPAKLVHDKPVAVVTWNWDVLEGRCAPPRRRGVRH